MSFKDQDINLLRKYCVNQIKGNNFHYGTTGEIYSFGYGPKYSRDPIYKYSVGKFAKKSTVKKIGDENMAKSELLEMNAEQIVESSIDSICCRLSCFKKSISPKVAMVPYNLDLFPEKQQYERRLANNGFINMHVCLNAQTSIQHTECDSSYTVITVPLQ